jgi:predicted nuclease of predicted toxin-antitoxin system
LKLLVDQNLPRRLSTLLLAEGHDALHTTDEGLATAADPLILSWCCTRARLLVTSDKKLTKFLASSGADCPSVLVVREMRTVPVETTAAIVAANLAQIEKVVVERGNALFSLTPGRPIRAELLPLGLIGPTAAKAETE